MYPIEPNAKVRGDLHQTAILGIAQVRWLAHVVRRKRRVVCVSDNHKSLFAINGI